LQKFGFGKSKTENKKVQRLLRMQWENELPTGGYFEGAALLEEEFQT
jgi:hypothetical protein